MGLQLELSSPNMRVTIILCLLACVAYQVSAEPQPQPFGLGLFGRLLSAVSRGEKEGKEGKGGGDGGNSGSGCNCRRKRTLFNREMEKMTGLTCSIRFLRCSIKLLLCSFL